MPIALNPEWPQLALYAIGAAFVLMLLFRLPYVGRALRALFSLAMLALCLLMVAQYVPFDPTLSSLANRAGFSGQQVAGEEVRIRMARDGHFWVNARINGVERRLLVDSGATITALSQATVAQAGVKRDATLVPVILQTANGAVRAQAGTVERLELGGIVARDLKVVTSPNLGQVNVLGMNFLSQLASWRVEGRTLILTPKPTTGATNDAG
ncbi:peptidase [Sphingomonas turrisvirgatae]|uniref:Peptidase n=2 Tax=Sphingomonas turrisvirgatae TaxID=1888892 RepID=A0A1E3LYB6_9SPHN|nr:TIGR02281 family clan AA aspartic protease [Sphingomonas turrisvirgatae]ODP38703.1 peptidase [Sphingomonas turrisvirgatae]